MFLDFLLLLVIYVFTNHFLNRIPNSPPSPFPALPIIGHLHLLKQPLHRSLSNISNRSSPVLLLQFGFRRFLLVSSPSVVEECFTKNYIIFANRPSLLAGKHLGYNFTSLVWAPYTDHWRNLHKISSLEIISSNRIQLLFSISNDEVKLLINRPFKNKDVTVDMKSALSELTLNVMVRMIYSREEVLW